LHLPTGLQAPVSFLSFYCFSLQYFRTYLDTEEKTNWRNQVNGSGIAEIKAKTKECFQKRRFQNISNQRGDCETMYKQIILNTVNKYLSEAATVDDESIENSIFKALNASGFDCIQYLGIDDNTLNGIDTKKVSWRTYFVNVRTEEDFFIEIKLMDSKSYEICCLVFDENDNLKPI
jgi:hypothetical protein